MDKRLLLASPHMSGEGYELEYINDAFRKNWIAPLGENVNEFEKAMGAGTTRPLAAGRISSVSFWTSGRNPDRIYLPAGRTVWQRGRCSPLPHIFRTCTPEGRGI